MMLRLYDEDQEIVEEIPISKTNPYLLAESELEDYSHCDIVDNEGNVIFGYLPGE